MSVIWSGVTEEGAVVPVQVTAEGKVVAVGDGPEGDYLKLTGGNLTGDLTVNEQITLGAANGSATFIGDVQVGGSPLDSAGPGTGTLLRSSNGITAAAPTGTLLWNGKLTGTPGSTSSIYSDGSATFTSTISINADKPSNNGYAIIAQTDSDPGSNVATVYAQNKKAGGMVYAGANSAGTATTKIFEDGSATFIGDVVIGSRGEQWLIRESNGVAMLVQQTLRQPREIEKLRDLPNELDLIEAALNEVMEKLRMTPPAGWPVWDGESEVTSDNDNA